MGAWIGSGARNAAIGGMPANGDGGYSLGCGCTPRREGG